jgi:hypothetical protein
MSFVYECERKKERKERKKEFPAARTHVRAHARTHARTRRDQEPVDGKYRLAVVYQRTGARQLEQSRTEQRDASFIASD